jgi:hypothetical protein
LFTSRDMALRITARKFKIASSVQWLSKDSAIPSSA